MLLQLSRLVVPGLILLVAGCSTSGDNKQAGAAIQPAEAIDAAWVSRNGPSTTERPGWVQTGSGWYSSSQACLRYQEKVTAGTGALAGEGCLEPGI